MFTLGAYIERCPWVVDTQAGQRRKTIPKYEPEMSGDLICELVN